MILFLWSIVAGAVGYLKRQRMAQWMKDVIVDSFVSGKQLILRRSPLSAPVVRPWQHPHPHHSRPCTQTDGAGSTQSTALLLWSTEDSEVVLNEGLEPLEASWWRIFDDLSPVRQEGLRTNLVFFTAISNPRNGDRASSSDERATFNIEDVCAPVAWRTDDDQITVVFACSIEQLTDVACAWTYGRAIFRDTFETEYIATERLSSEFIRTLGLEDIVDTPSTSKINDKCNGVLANGGSCIPSAVARTAVTTVSLSTSGCCTKTVETITTTANGGNNLVGADEGGGLTRTSVLCSLEQLCLGDILAAKDLCRSLGAFDGDLSTERGGDDASVYYTCNRDFEPEQIGVVTTRPVNAAPSISSSRDTSGLTESDMTTDSKQSDNTTAGLTPLTVDIFSGVSDFLSISSDHLSPCHGFNDRLLDRRWYSTWRCDSMDSSFSGGDGVVTRQPAGSLPSRSSSSSKRRSVRSDATRAKSRSDSLQIASMSRRWSLPSPPQVRARSASYGKSKFRMTPVVKPPNILIYTGGDDSSNDLFTRLAATVGRSVHADKYVIYRLKRARFLIDPWPSNSVCIVLADTTGLDDRCWQRLFDYFKCGGKMFFVCENRLLASLNDSGSTKRKYDLLKLAFDTNQQSRNQKDFKEFLKRLSKALKKPSVCEHFNVLSADGRPRFTLTFVREESTPLILYMQNAQDRAVALFSDVTLDAFVAAGRVLINEVLQRLGLELSTGEVPILTPGYLLFENQEAKEQLAGAFLSLGRIDDGRTSIEFFNRSTVPADRVTATRLYLPVWINAEDRAVGFDAADYYEHLSTERIGRCVLYVPVSTSTMSYFEGLVAKLSDKFAVVAIARSQLEGQGRGGNRFLSPDGCVSFTVGLRMPSHSRLAQSPGFAQHLLALAAVDSICSFREDLATFHLRLKWPNDIYYGIGRLVKVGGVLVNWLAKNDSLFFIAGLGLNLANGSPTICINDMLPPEIPSFRTEQVIALTLSRLEKLIDLFERRGHDAILPLYYKYWLHNYQEITLAETKERVIVRGLDKKGYLEVRSRQTGRVFSLQPDANTFDMMHNLIKIKE